MSICNEIKNVKPYESVIVRGVVKKEPHVIKGGHVIFSIHDGNEIECAAYEPTKRFRNVIKKLRKGDVVVVYRWREKNCRKRLFDLHTSELCSKNKKYWKGRAFISMHC